MMPALPTIEGLRCCRPAPPRAARCARRRAAAPRAAAAAAASAPEVVVVGAGVVGLTTAVRLLDRGLRVAVVAEHVGAEGTTSAGAGGLWKPYSLGADQDAALVDRWGRETLRHYIEDIYMVPARSSSSGESGGGGGGGGGECSPAGLVSLTSGYQLLRSAATPDPGWAPAVPHFRHMTRREVALYAPAGGGYQAGWFFTTAIVSPAGYLGWLLCRLRAAEARGAARLVRRRVASLAEALGAVPRAAAVVNAAGLGARGLADVADAALVPVRGQVLRVRAPWVKHYINLDAAEGADPTEGAACYVIPQPNGTVVLGGTLGVGDEGTEARAADRAGILARCLAAVPALAEAEIEGDWVGLRPRRASVRLEAARVEGVAAPVVHNYGHGGSGFTLAWGCAGDAAALVAAELGV